MKKTLVCCCLVFLLFFVVSAKAAPLQHVYDQTSTFSQEDVQFLEAEMQKLYEDTGIDSMIVTTMDSLGYKAEEFAAHFYEQVRDYEQFEHYVIFAFCFDIGQRGAYGEASYGRADQLLTRRGNEDLRKVLAPYLPSKNYGAAMRDYVSYLRNIFTQTAFQSAARFLPYIVVGAFLLSLFIVFSMKHQLKIARKKSNAAFYIRPDSLYLTNQQDIFLYTTETRQKIETSSSSGSSGRSFQSSGSGRSYGGRSGSL